MIWPFRRKAKAKKPVTKLRIFLWPFLICLVIAVIDLALPLEDLYRGGRNYLRLHAADQKTVVVAIDDKTVQHFKTSYYSRRHNAELLDLAFAAGVNRIFFDESFKLPLDAEGDDLFAQALTRHRGKVHIGAIDFKHYSSDQMIQFLPIDKFRSSAELRSMRGIVGPFNLSSKLYYRDVVEGKEIPSISAGLANVQGDAGSVYAPDFSIDYKTVPTISLIDAINNRAPAGFFAGKDLVVGVTAQTESDFFYLVGQGMVPGVYAQVLGAQTLREGKPIDLGGLPPLIAAALLSFLLLNAKSGRATNLIVAGAAILALAIPMVADAYFIHMSFIPSYILFFVVALRSNSLRAVSEARLRNSRTLLPNLSALHEEPTARSRSIIAMRIRNYAAVCASFPDAVEEDLIRELSRRLTLPGEATVFYQAEEVLYWLGSSVSHKEIEEHLSGLAQLIESHLIIQGRKLDIHVVFGVDTALERPIANRIGRALLAADQAVAKHQLVHFNTSNNDEESAWELSLMSELDDAIEHGHIWVAYQPQFDLRNDQIIGAEALVRWQHPSRGAISPEAFVLAAESHNRITRLTQHVLEQAVSSAAVILATNPDFRISVNISAVLLENSRLPSLVEDILRQKQFPASNLTLEVTESAPFSEHAVVAQNLASISDLGIELSIDDYGTGNATLDYIRSVPCQEIKIDRRFVSNLVSNASDMILVESTIELAHGLGRRVIAEGIEDPETLELLRSLRCDIAQGYYLAKPMRIEALESLIASSNRLRVA